MPPPLKSKRRQYTHGFLLIILSAGIIYSIYSYVRFGTHEGAIPRHIAIDHVVKSRNQLSGISEGCGGAVFHIARSSMKAINREGVAFLNQDLYGRNYLDRDKNGGRYHHYHPWRPAADLMENQVRWDGISCLVKGDTELSDIIHSALQSPTTYYTYGHETTLLVIPEHQLLVFVYAG